MFIILFLSCSLYFKSDEKTKRLSIIKIWIKFKMSLVFTGKVKSNKMRDQESPDYSNDIINRSLMIFRVRVGVHSAA